MMWFLLWAACGAFAALIAQTKGYSVPLWLVLGLMFGPLALLGIGFMEKKEAAAEEEPDTDPCPVCREPVRLGAIRCRFCGSDIVWE